MTPLAVFAPVRLTEARQTSRTRRTAFPDVRHVLVLTRNVAALNVGIDLSVPTTSKTSCGVVPLLSSSKALNAMHQTFQRPGDRPQHLNLAGSKS